LKENIPTFVQEMMTRKGLLLVEEEYNTLVFEAAKGGYRNVKCKMIERES
jgi:hypothetical protein